MVRPCQGNSALGTKDKATAQLCWELVLTQALGQGRPWCVITPRLLYHLWGWGERGKPALQLCPLLPPIQGSPQSLLIQQDPLSSTQRTPSSPTVQEPPLCFTKTATPEQRRKGQGNTGFPLRAILFVLPLCKTLVLARERKV